MTRENEHGKHTLRVQSGLIVGVNGDDVFVELGPRMQGVISVQQFDEKPALGEEHEFTLHGQEDGLWALSRVDATPLDSWTQMEVGSWVQSRVTGKNPGGLELKVGPLHAFMPKSETGLARDEDPQVLVGTEITSEVIEIDRERQRVLLSRKAVIRKQQEGEHQHQVGALKPGQVINGRVTRIEPFGAFVSFGQGLEGLIHISNLSLERVGHPDEVVTKGQSVEAKVLTIRQNGQRIGLGLKQMVESPWKGLERTHYIDQIVEGTVTRTADFGAFVSILKGVEGLLHESESGLGSRRLRDVARKGQTLPVRIVSIDIEAERMSLSRMHRSGALIQPDEVLEASEVAELESAQETAPVQTNLGSLLKQALQTRKD
jgi:small subunit ribosomal protein S1